MRMRGLVSYCFVVLSLSACAIAPWSRVEGFDADLNEVTVRIGGGAEMRDAAGEARNYCHGPVKLVRMSRRTADDGGSSYSYVGGSARHPMVHTETTSGQYSYKVYTYRCVGQ